MDPALDGTRNVMTSVAKNRHVLTLCTPFKGQVYPVHTESHV